MVEEGAASAIVEDGFSKVDNNSSDFDDGDLGNFGSDTDSNEEQNP